MLLICHAPKENWEEKADTQPLLPCQTFHQPVIHFTAHKAEADIPVVQKGEGGAVPNHHFLPDGPVKQFPGGHGVRQKAHQHEIAAGRISSESRIFGKNPVMEVDWFPVITQRLKKKKQNIMKNAYVEQWELEWL